MVTSSPFFLTQSFFRTLGTPTEDIWPGITSYPDFKSSHPKWPRIQHRPLVSGLDEAGLELLDMMLIYDPAGRISAKQACNHPYLEDVPIMLRSNVRTTDYY